MAHPIRRPLPPPPKPERPPTAAELVATIIRVLDEKQAAQTVALDLRGRGAYTDFVVVAHGGNDRHVKTLAEHLVVTLKHRGVPVHGLEGEQHGMWILCDFVEVVVHLFYEPVRAHYDIEGLWADAPRLDIDGILAGAVVPEVDAGVAEAPAAARRVKGKRTDDMPRPSDADPAPSVPPPKPLRGKAAKIDANPKPAAEALTEKESPTKAVSRKTAGAGKSPATTTSKSAKAASSASATKTSAKAPKAAAGEAGGAEAKKARAQGTAIKAGEEAPATPQKKAPPGKKATVGKAAAPTEAVPVAETEAAPVRRRSPLADRRKRKTVAEAGEGA